MSDIGLWFQGFWSWSLQPIAHWMEFALRYAVGLYFFFIVVRWLARVFPKSTKGEQFGKSEIKTFRSQNDEMVIGMTGTTLKDRHFTDGQKVNLCINGGEPIPVTIRKRNKSVNLDNGQIQVAIAILMAAGVEEDKLARIVLSGVPFGVRTIMLQSFDHPDVNVRLAWLLSLWSFIASTVAGIMISHFHMLVAK